ncbi:MAG: NYN domain-containing protein [Phycisphaerales bacterium]|nr:NYN domain-containing protein [Phycisphaerales bacterium]
MRVIVDAWNVLHVEGVLPPGLAGLDLAGLGRLMQATRWRASHGTLVCDGAAQPRPEGLPDPIHVLWSGHTREADDLIEDVIARTTTPGRLVVVSSDNRLIRAAKRRRCNWLRSDAFLRTMLDDLARGKPNAARPGSGTNEDWKDLFGFGAEELSALHAEVNAADLPRQEEPAKSQPKQPEPVEEDLPALPPMSFPASVLEQAMKIARGN